MQEDKLPRNFFKDNPVNEFSTAQLTYFQMVMLGLPELNDKISNMANTLMKTSRLEECEQEKNRILGSDTAEEVIKHMRTIKNPQNRKLIVEKALTLQEDIMPLILKRLQTSAHDVFIETSAMIFANGDMKYVEQLFNIFTEIRSPYARSATSIVFGVKKRTDYTSLLLKQYMLIKQEEPDKDYEQGPLLALHLIHGELERS